MAAIPATTQRTVRRICADGGRGMMLMIQIAMTRITSTTRTLTSVGTDQIVRAFASARNAGGVSSESFCATASFSCW